MGRTGKANYIIGGKQNGKSSRSRLINIFLHLCFCAFSCKKNKRPYLLNKKK
jgi:hypothetical protein